MFGFLVPISYELVFSSEEYLARTGPKLNYSSSQYTDNEIFIPSGTILFERNIQRQPIEFFTSLGLRAFFRKPTKNIDFPFDLPGLVFFLATRYEEYLPFTADQWGRFSSKNAVATQGDFLHQPLIECWVQRLLLRLKEQFPDLEVNEQNYRFEPTYDIDIAWAYLHRPLLLQAASTAKDLILQRWSSLRARWRTWTKRQIDPFFTFDYLTNLHQRFGLKPHFFFLLADRHRNDPNISHQIPAMRRLVQQLAAQGNPCGIHPSFASNQLPAKIVEEKNRLAEILEKPVNTSRQHFLKLSFPITYQRLIAAGIQHDYSMGYADSVGFRASISRAYPWYDLQNEETTTLMIHPFIAMDVTLKQYLKLQPQAAIEVVRQLIEAAKAVQGVAGLLWHNSSFAPHEGWEGWQNAYEAIIADAVETKE
jgi:hypothetical protein